MMYAPPGKVLDLAVAHGKNGCHDELMWERAAPARLKIG